MTQYSNENKGVLFKNDRKQQDTHPDYKGFINIDGKEYWLSGWKKEPAKGPLLSLSVKPKEAKQEQKQQASPQSFDDFESDLPF